VPSATERDPTSLETASIWAPFFYARTFARVSSGIDGLSFSTRKSTKTRTRDGKVRYVGVSNFSGWQVMKSLAVAEQHGWPRYVAHQVYYSLIGRDYEWDLMPLGADQSLGALVWSPLGWGRLNGKIRRASPIPEGSRLHETASFGPPVENDYLYTVIEALDAVAQETGKTVPQIALNWLLQRPTVSSVIIGARNEAQLRDNLGAIGWTLTDDQVARLDAASAVTAPYPHFPYRRQEAFARLNSGCCFCPRHEPTTGAACAPVGLRILG
jgi:aryl-alcohol dehydrogenase (NADP+)